MRKTKRATRSRRVLGAMIFVLLATCVLAWCDQAVAAAATIPGSSLSIRKTGIDSAPAAECVIVARIDSPNSRSVTGAVHWAEKGELLYSATSGDEGLFYGDLVMPDADGSEWSIAGEIRLDYTDGLLDAEGGLHDLHIRIDNFHGRWYKVGDDAKGKTFKKALVELNKGSFDTQGFGQRMWDSRGNLYDMKDHGGNYWCGMSMRVSVWADGIDGLAYNTYFYELDEPSGVKGGGGADAATYAGKYAESVLLNEGQTTFPQARGEIYLNNPTSLVYDQTSVGSDDIWRLRGSTPLSSGDTAAQDTGRAIIPMLMGASSESGVNFVWRGTGCGTVILSQRSHSLVTEAGEGGHAFIGSSDAEALTSTAARPEGGSVAGTVDVDETALGDGAYVTHREISTIPKRTYTTYAVPDEGWRVIGMEVDGVAVSASGAASQVTDLVATYFEDSKGGWAYAVLSGVSTDHVVRFLFEPAAGTVRLTKTSTEPALTSVLPDSYSLAGAEFELCDDSGAKVGTLVTDASGRAELGGVDAGTYTVRETKAPKGFIRATDPQTVTVPAGGTGEVSFADVPRTMVLRIRKQDADTGEAAAQGEATLADATFQIDWWATDHPTTGKPDRTWVTRSGDDGIADLDADHLESGDDPFEDADGKPVLPAGSWRVSEMRPPSGYALPDDAVVGQGVVDSSTDEAVVTLRVQDPVVRGGIRVAKADAASGDPLAGAVFSVTNRSAAMVVVNGRTYAAGEVVCTMESGADGIASTSESALPYGTYEVREVKAPTGWLLNDSWSKTVQVHAAGMASTTLGPCKDDPVTASVQIRATKRFDGTAQGRELEAGMFTFRLLDSEGAELAEATNDADGSVDLGALVFFLDDLGGKTEAERQYRIIEVQGEDEEIVYDEHEEEFVVRLHLDGEALVAEALYDADGAVFENSCVPPLEMPLTGRQGLRLVPVVGIALCTAALSGAALLRRRG